MLRSFLKRRSLIGGLRNSACNDAKERGHIFKSSVNLPDVLMQHGDVLKMAINSSK